MDFWFEKLIKYGFEKKTDLNKWIFNGIDQGKIGAISLNWIFCPPLTIYIIP